ncbi:MAG: nodulation protein NfeD [Deltaproteobacteria bacterium]|nr:nodulation protein NfeD [Deltaproteobacteria bacterium]
MTVASVYGAMRRRAATIVWTLMALAWSIPGGAGELFIARIDGSINPASSDYLMAAIEKAEDAGAAALLIELDTPGGLVSSTQDIIQKMLNAKLPVIVYVTPRGAWAASAGTFITLASTVAVMSPGSSIGAAHPVSAFGGSGGGSGESESESPARDIAAEKAENFLAAYAESIAQQKNRNVEWAVDAVRNSVAVTAEEALELGVIDLIAENRSEMLAALDGRKVQVDGREMTLALASVTVVEIEMTLVQVIFNFLADPNVAVILFAIGALGLYMEFQSPGMIVPGAIGVGALILAGFAFQILPFSGIGLLLILIGMALLVAELFVVSFGLVFERPELSDLTVSFWEVLVPIAAALSVVGVVIVYSLGKTLFIRPTMGPDEMIGMVGRSESVIDPRGKVFVRGEYWNVVADTPIEAGESVEVLSVKGLVLHVRKAKSNDVAR